MKWKNKKLLSCVVSIAIALSFFTACGEKEQPKEVKADNTFVTTDDYSDCERMLSNMTTEEKIALKIMPTFRYNTDDAGALIPVKQVNQDIEMILSRHGFAGVILFAQNISNAEQTYKLIYDLQAANSGENRTKLFIATDQEGGSIARIDYGTSFCGNMALAASGDTNNAFECGKTIGEELSTLGFNVDFAPVLDINTNPLNPVIGTRAFSDDPTTAAKFGNAFIEGLHAENICTAVKHFPGHGDTDTDSHTGLPCIDKSYEEIKELELLPFKQCAANTDMIMTAHIQFPQIETNTYISKSTGEEIYLPATLSKTIIDGILREDMGYEGVVITDAMQMEAISTHFDEFDSAKLAFNAGVDILLMPLDMYSADNYNEMTGYIQDLALMANKGDISLEEIDKSVLRILNLKKDKGLLNSEDLPQLNYESLSSVGSEEHRQAEWDITKKTITLIKNENNALPIKSNKTVIIAQDNEQSLLIQDMIELLKKEGKLELLSDVSVISSEMGEDDIYEEIDSAESVIALSDVESTEQLNPYNDSSNIDSYIYRTHENGAKFILISCGLPYDCARYSEADSIMIAWCLRGGSEDTRVADANLVNFTSNIPCALYFAFSNESPTGKLPLTIPTLDFIYGYSGEILYSRGYGIGY